MLVARNAQTLLVQQPAEECVAVAEQLGAEAAPQGQQPCSDSGTAEAATAAGAQAGFPSQAQQPEPCHQIASQPNVGVDADADKPTASEPALLPAHPLFAAVSPAGSDIVIDLLSDDSDDSMATASPEGSGRAGVGGTAAPAAATSGTIVISESAPQQSQDESDMSMHEADEAVSPDGGVLPRPTWVPRCGQHPTLHTHVLCPIQLL